MPDTAQMLADIRQQNDILRQPTRRDPTDLLAANVARLTECVTRAIDAIDEFAAALSDLPEPSHVLYRRRLIAWTEDLSAEMRAAKALLIVDGAEGRP